MKKFDNIDNIICSKMKQHSNWMGKAGKSPCTQLASYTNGTQYFCRHHSRMGRFVARIGDVGKIMARFDTEQDLRDNIYLYPECRMQKLTHSYRRDLY